MISQRTLEDAVARGVIDAAQADTLRAIEAGYAAVADAPPRDAERLRFVSGFADIFVTIGIGLFLGALAMLWGLTTPGAIGLVAASWLLAELFARRRRMALPSLALTGAFAISAGLLALNLITPVRDGVPLETAWRGDIEPATLSFAAIAAGALLLLHYWRFRVPATPAAIAGVLVFAGYMPLDAAFPDLPKNLFIFLAGIAAFALAMWFDARDPLRTTNRAEIAFWLHLLAAPLIVHETMRGIGGEGTLDPLSAALVLVVFLGLGVIALLINRRAILVSGLFYAGGALAALTEGRGLDGLVLPIALLLLGAFVLLLSIGWEPLRRRALALLPEGARRMLPPVTVPLS